MSFPFASVPANGKQAETSIGTHDVDVFEQISVPLPGVGVQTGVHVIPIDPVRQLEHSSVLHAAAPTHSEHTQQLPAHCCKQQFKLKQGEHIYFLSPFHRYHVALHPTDRNWQGH